MILSALIYSNDCTIAKQETIHEICMTNAIYKDHPPLSQNNETG